MDSPANAGNAAPPTPTPAQRFLANHGPTRLLLGTALFLGALGMGIYLVRIAGVPTDLWSGLRLLFAMALAALAAMFSAFLLSLFILSPIYYSQGIANGAPYQPGDLVLLLVGPHQGKVLPVYQVWDQRSEVRVWIGEPEERRADDVFGYTQVLRVPHPQTDPPGPPPVTTPAKPLA